MIWWLMVKIIHSTSRGPSLQGPEGKRHFYKDSINPAQGDYFKAILKGYKSAVL